MRAVSCPTGQISRHLSARGCLRGQDPQGSENRGFAGAAADEVRIRHQSQSGKRNRSDDSGRNSLAGESSDQVRTINLEAAKNWVPTIPPTCWHGRIG